jgi:glycosyltransferase involved in cell wall biosynthesis
MRLTATVEYRFDQTPDGAVWTNTTFPYEFWTRYLEVFDAVNVVARAKAVHSVPESYRRVDGENVSFTALPHYIGPLQFLLRLRRLKQSALEVVAPDDAVIFRLGSILADLVESSLRATGHPYGVQVVSDPYDAFAPGAIPHPLRSFFRWYFPRRLRRLCENACASAYVTRERLQRRYPPVNSVHTTFFSDIEYPDSAFVAQPRTYVEKDSPLNLVMVGSLDQLYKAPHILIDAVAAVLREGVDLKLKFVGDGKHRSDLEAQVERLGIGQKVVFLGEISSGEAVLKELDESDLFVLPSFTEGLPRAMIEAMARGLPCIGSTAGGFPEILEEEDMVSPGDREALSKKICEVVLSPERMTEMSRRSLEVAREYKKEILRARRVKFYQAVREQTEAWIQSRKT